MKKPTKVYGNSYVLLQSKKLVGIEPKWELFAKPRSWEIGLHIHFGKHVIGIGFLCFDLAIRRTKNGE